MGRTRREAGASPRYKDTRPSSRTMRATTTHKDSAVAEMHGCVIAAAKRRSSNAATQGRAHRGRTCCVGPCPHRLDLHPPRNGLERVRHKLSREGGRSSERHRLAHTHVAPRAGPPLALRDSGGGRPSHCSAARGARDGRG